MAAITVSTNSNFDATANAGLLNGEDITINTGAKLTIDSDVRWSYNGAVPGFIYIDSSTGGEVHVDATKTWWLPYGSGASTVPALKASNNSPDIVYGETSGAYGELLGFWTGLGVAPTAASSAVPTDGFIKLRSKTGTFASGENLRLNNQTTGTLVGVTSGAGQRGWLHFVGEETSGFGSSTTPIPRLGTVRITGDWFEVGTTSGSRNQTIQLPVADYYSGVWIETAVGSNTYEFWPNAGAQLTTTIFPATTTDVRAKVVYVSSAGVLRIGSTTTPADAAYLPVSGLKIRVPNLFISSSNSTNWTLNTLSTTLSTRYDFDVSRSGVVVIDKVASAGLYPYFVQPYSLSITDSVFADTLVIQECATSFTVTNTHVSVPTTVNTYALSLTSCFNGGTISNCVFARLGLGTSGYYINYGINISGITFSNVTTLNLTGVRGNATSGSWTVANPTNCTWTGCTSLGGGRLLISTGKNCTISNLAYADVVYGATATTNPMSCVDLVTKCDGITVSGISWLSGLTNIHAYNAAVSVNTCDNIKIRNIGAPTAELDGGTANLMRTGILSLGNSTNLKFQRCYFKNIRYMPVASSTSGGALANTDSGVLLENIWGDAEDTTTIAGLNTLIRGHRGINATSGQTAVYGTHWFDTFTSTTEGRVLVMGNEKTGGTMSNASYTITAGTPKFNSVGSVLLQTAGDEIIWETPYWVKGHTSFANAAATITGTVTYIAITYDIDKGAGFSGSYKTLNAANLYAESGINATTGFRLRIKATATSSNTASLITCIRITTVTDATTQQLQYDLDPVEASITLTGLKAGSEVRIYKASDSSELAGVESSGTSFTYNYLHTGTDISVFIIVHALGYLSARYTDILLTASGLSIPVQQQVDRVYKNPA